MDSPQRILSRVIYVLKEHWWPLYREQTTAGREVSRETSSKASAQIWARDDGGLVYGLVVRMMKGGQILDIF